MQTQSSRGNRRSFDGHRQAPWRRCLLAACILPSMLLPACGSGKQVEIRCDPQIGHYLARPRDLQKVRTVAFVGLGSDIGREKIAGQLSESLFADLQGKGLWSIELVERDDRRCENMPIDQEGNFELSQLSAMRNSFTSDAVLLGRIEHFQVPPRMKVTLSLMLVDLRNGKLLWRVNHSWDTTDEELSDRIHDYFEDELADQYRPMGDDFIHKSPRAFMKFVAFEASGTVPCKAHLVGPPPSDCERLVHGTGKVVKKIGKCVQEDE